LTPVSWKTDARFVDDQGNPLSDHLAVAVEFTWRAQSPASKRHRDDQLKARL
jgi:hypothetical protein